MKNILLIVLSATIAIVLNGHCLHAADIEIAITDYPRQVVPGIPAVVTGTVKNVSGKRLELACGGLSYKVGYDLRRADGRPRKTCSFESTTSGGVNLGPMILAKDWQEPIGVDLNCGEEAPVELVLEVSFTVSKCPYTTLVEGADRIWDGAVKSSQIHIAIIEPKGVDKEAYEAFHHSPYEAHWKELIKKYPTSIYAGYQFKHLFWYLRSDLDTLTSPEYLKKFPLITDPFGGDSNGNPMVPSRQAVRERIKLFSDYLRAHPDFPYRADYLEGWLAQVYLIDGRYQDAYESYDWLAKNSKDKNSIKTAEDMKVAMVKKGLVTGTK